MKTLIAVVVSLFGNIFAYFAGMSSAKNRINAELQKRARVAEQVGYEAGRDGVMRERENQEKPVDTKKRDHFES